MRFAAYRRAHIVLQSTGRFIIHSAGFIVMLIGEKETVGDVIGCLLIVN